MQAPEQAPALEAPATVPQPPKRFDLHVRMDQGFLDKLAHAQNLLGDAVRFGDVAQVLDRALDALIERLEKRKFAATSRRGAPRGSRPTRARSRRR